MYFLPDVTDVLVSLVTRPGYFLVVAAVLHGVWCNAPSRNYFCATEIAESKKGIFLFPLVEMLLSPKGTKPLEEF